MEGKSEQNNFFMEHNDQGENMELRVRRKVAQDLYKQLYQDHTADEKEFLKTKTSEQVPKSLWERLTVSNILWVIASMVLLYSSDIARTGLYDERVKRTWFNIGAVLVCFNICVAGFLIVYASYLKKIRSDDWEFHYPAAIPLATASFIFGATCWVVAFWPIYNYFTPVLLFTIFMGFVVMVSWLP